MSKALVLRTCNKDMKAYGGFQWPESGYVEAPDFVDDKKCGQGLHGLLWGEGSASYLDLSDDAKWLVCEVEEDKCIDLNGKVKFRSCEVVYCGNRDGAVNYIAENGGESRTIVFGTATAGDVGTATAGDEGTATAGDGGTATAGDVGTATAGKWGTATAGKWGTATAGDGGTATAGDGGTATAGDEGILVIKRWDGKRYKLEVAYVGEEGIKPDTAYKLDDDGNFIEIGK